jgi:hypothetical protein
MGQMHLKRRQMLGGMAATIALAAALPKRARTATAPSPAGGPAVLFEPGRLPSASQVWAWVETLNGFGPRLTGSEAHRRSIDFLAAELQTAGLNVRRDTRHFRLWQARRWSLELVSTGGGTTTVPTAFYFPYSGETPPQGVSGELVPFDEPPRSFAAAAHKIAVIDVPTPALSWLFQYLMFTRKSSYPDQSADFDSTMSTPLLGGTLKAAGVDLKAAAAAGVLGVVCVWRGCSEENARNQYLPFTTPYQGCPAVWVGRAAGATLRAAAQRGARARLTLEADITERAPTDTLFAVLPGTNTAETIIINTHTDGPNACEENGGAGVLALARYFAGRPVQPRRTLVFVLATGHFQLPQLGGGGQATTAWLRAHPELWDGKQGHARAVAGLTLEHLGCTEWKDDADAANFRPTGRLERELVYTTNTAMDSIWRGALVGRRKLRTLTLTPRNGVFFGEGQPLFQAGIPGVALFPIPDYLCSASPDGGGKLDAEFMHEQIASFARALLRIDAMTAAELGPVDPQDSNFGGFVLKQLTGRG